MSPILAGSVAVIVNVAAWLYLANAGLLVVCALWPLPGRGIGGFLGAALFAAAAGVIGIGLLRRETWGRWLALGPSLLGWTIGGVVSLLMLALVFWFHGKVSDLGGVARAVEFFLVLFALLSLAGVVINFKLYRHLMSEEGREEFGAPESETFTTVLQSAGVWIAACLVLPASSGSSLMSPAVSSAWSESPHRELPAPERAPIERESREPPRPQAAVISAAPAAAPVPVTAMPLGAPQIAQSADDDAPPGTIAESRLPDFGALEGDEEEAAPDMKRILKCRSPSGAITFTQGYCPNGSQEVPRSEAQ